jgi:tetratricopeptide (TPR) repeat protein
MKRPLFPLLSLLLLVGASPAWAIEEWYDHYRDAESAMRRGQYQDALRSLQEAVRLRPSSGMNVRTYGMDFVESYFPYYQQGVCYLRLNDENSAIRLFNIEESRGQIRSSRLYESLVRQREQAQAQVEAERQRAEKQQGARRAAEEVDRLRRESVDLHREGKLEDALARLAQAEKVGEILEPAVRQQIADQVKRIRAEQTERAERAAATQKVEEGLARGRRLLEQEKAAEARIAFEGVLALDPRNAVAQEGKREAEARIMAETTQQERDAAFRSGKALFEAGQFEQSLKPLTEAAADPTNREAAALLDRAQKTFARMRFQKDVHARIESLLADGEKLIAGGQLPQAVVKLSTALELDPLNTLVRERLQHAERMMRDEALEKTYPNKPPEVAIWEPPPGEMEGATFTLLGQVIDDRGIARVEYRSGPQVVASHVLSPAGSGGELPRNFRIEQKFDLESGPNTIAVTVTDARGLTNVQVFRVRRKLRFHETAAFLPSAVTAAAAVIGIVWLAQRARRRRAMRSRFNPYIAGAPVMTDDLFFGRQKLLARILNVLHHNSLLITGERRIGKTTFLYHLRKALLSDDQTGYRFFPVLTDLQGVPEDAFFHTIMSDVVEGLALKPETLAALRFRREEPRYDGRDFSHDLQRVIDELKTRTPLHVKLAMLVDEVDVLNEYSERVNQRLRSIFMKTFSEHLVAVMSGVGIKRLWTSEGSPWYNFFDEIELSAFTREEAEALIREPVEGVFRYEPTAVAAILDASDLKPYIVQKFCIHAVNRMLEAGRTTVTAEDVDAVRDEVLREGRDETPAETPLAHASA